MVMFVLIWSTLLSWSVVLRRRTSVVGGLVFGEVSSSYRWIYRLHRLVVCVQVRRLLRLGGF